MADKAIATGTARDLVFMLAKLEDDTVYDVVPHREKRSLNANGLLWACISEIANKIGHDKWSVYLNMLKSYGQYTYVLCKPHAVAKVKEVWLRSSQSERSLAGNGRNRRDRRRRTENGSASLLLRIIYIRYKRVLTLVRRRYSGNEELRIATTT